MNFTGAIDFRGVVNFNGTVNATRPGGSCLTHGPARLENIGPTSRKNIAKPIHEYTL